MKTNGSYCKQSCTFWLSPWIRLLLFCLVFGAGFAGILGCDTSIKSFSNPAPYPAYPNGRSAPSPPTNISATAGDGQVTITWDWVSGATSYNLYWSWGPDVSIIPGTPILNVSSGYSHFGLTNGIIFHYVVTAVNTHGESDTSYMVSATPQAPHVDPHRDQWAKTYGGSSDETRFSHTIQQTVDGGYIVAGSSTSFTAPMDEDIWVLKLDSTGDILWEKTYGGASGDSANAIEQTEDGGYVVSGHTYSYGAGNNDIWVLKLDANGSILWQKTYGGSGYDNSSSIQQTADGGYIVAGDTNSFGAVSKDFWVLKLDAGGDILWEKAYGNDSSNLAYCIRQTTDDGYVVAGHTADDVWVIKLDSNGNVLWQNTFGETGEYRAYSVEQTTDNGYIVAGSSVLSGNYDFFLLKLNASGNEVWQKTYGGPWGDVAYSIQQTTDEGYVVAGHTSSFGTEDNDDIWVLKLDPNGDSLWQKTYGGSHDDSAHSVAQTAEGGYILAGYTDSFASGGAGDSDFWVLKLNRDGTLGCGLETDTFVIPDDTIVSGAATTTAGEITDADVADTTITDQNSSATVNEQCSPAPSLPENMAAVAGNEEIKLSWDLVSGAASYNIYWSTSSGVTTLDTSINTTSMPYLHTGLTNGETYFYVVTAENSYGSESGLSDEVSATPQVCQDVSGNWILAVSNISSSCGDGEDWTSNITITQTGCSLETTGIKNTSSIVGGHINGFTFTIGPGAFPEDSGTTTATYTMTVEASGNMKGNESWEWEADDGSTTCSAGIADVAVTRR